MGGYSSNPTVAEETEANFHHSIGGMAEDGTIFDPHAASVQEDDAQEQ